MFNPYRDIASANARLAFIAVRIVGAVLLVPVMEELFWRDYLWRQILAPNDFKLASVGEWGLAPFLIVPAAFAFVHGNWWLTSVVWALMIGGLLVYTKSLARASSHTPSPTCCWRFTCCGRRTGRSGREEARASSQ